MSATNGKSSAMVQAGGAAAKQQTLAKLLEDRKASIAAVLPKHMTPERLLKVALTATARTPALLACSPSSVLLAVMQAAELGLEAGGILGEGYLVPYKGTCVFIAGYRGLITLARRSGEMRSIEAFVVRKADSFDIEFGLEPKLTHRPSMVGELSDDDIVAVYAIARFRDGSVQVDVMTRAEVDRIRKRSAAAGDGPWVTDFAEMAKKTVVRRLCKYLPLSPELKKALEHETAIDQNVASPIVDIQLEEAPAEEPKTRGDALREKLGADEDGVMS